MLEEIVKIADHAEVRKFGPVMLREIYLDPFLTELIATSVEVENRAPNVVVMARKRRQTISCKMFVSPVRVSDFSFRIISGFVASFRHVDVVGENPWYTTPKNSQSENQDENGSHFHRYRLQ